MPAVDRALGSGGPRQSAGDDHAAKIEEAARHVYDAYPDDHPYGEIRIPRSADGVPEVWVLGSSPSSAKIAADLGLPYAFAAFIRPTVAATALDTYRERFQPSEFDEGLDEPHSMLAANVACAETDHEAARLRLLLRGGLPAHGPRRVRPAPRPSRKPSTRDRRRPGADADVAVTERVAPAPSRAVLRPSGRCWRR